MELGVQSDLESIEFHMDWWAEPPSTMESAPLTSLRTSALRELAAVIGDTRVAAMDRAPSEWAERALAPTEFSRENYMIRGSVRRLGVADAGIRTRIDDTTRTVKVRLDLAGLRVAADALLAERRVECLGTLITRGKSHRMDEVAAAASAAVARGLGREVAFARGEGVATAKSVAQGPNLVQGVRA